MKVAIQIFMGLIILAVFVIISMISFTYKITGFYLGLIYFVVFLITSLLMTAVVFYVQKKELERKRQEDEKKR